MLPIVKDLLTNSRNRPFLRDASRYSIKQLKGIVAHWTANTNNGATARANRNYFNITDRYASAHYIVDDHTILQCIPDNEVAYHVGGAYYRPDGETIIAGTSLTPNYFLVGIEMCVNADGDWNKTYKNAVDLYAHLLYKYRLTVYDMYRHYDITGKDCPKMMLTEAEWWSLRRDVSAALSRLPERPLAQGKVSSPGLNVRGGIGTGYPVKEVLKKGDWVQVFEDNQNWYRIGDQRWVSGNYIDITSRTRLGEVYDATGANVRQGPGLQHPISDALPLGSICDIYEEQNGWYRIGHNEWAYQSVVRLIAPRTGYVTATTSLNVRSGPNTSYRIVRVLHNADQVYILETSGNWLRIGPNQWVYGGFIHQNPVA